LAVLCLNSLQSVSQKHKASGLGMEGRSTTYLHSCRLGHCRRLSRILLGTAVQETTFVPAVANHVHLESQSLLLRASATQMVRFVCSLGLHQLTASGRRPGFRPHHCSANCGLKGTSLLFTSSLIDTSQRCILLLPVDKFIIQKRKPLG
jgi:hypothetical protein